MTDDPIPPPPLRLDLLAAAGGAALRVEGEIDLSTAGRFQDALLEALEGRRDLLVDLRAVSFMDSTGLRALLEAHRRVEAAGGAMIVALEPEGPVERLLELAGVLELFARREQDHGAR